MDLSGWNDIHASVVRNTLQRYANPGIIIASVGVIYEPVTGCHALTVIYVRESEGQLTQQFVPGVYDSARVHEFKSYSFHVRSAPGKNTVDAGILLGKLALIR